MVGFLRELKADVQSHVPLVMWITISFAVAVSGPFGSYGELSLVQRFGFWPPLIGVGVAVGSLIRALVYGKFGLYGRLSGSFLIAGLVCIALCPPLYLVVKFMFDPMFGGVADFLEIFLLIASLTLGVCALRISVQPEQPLSEAPLVVEPLPEARLMRRIEPPLRGDLWAITVRDHYVDVQTSVGKTSILMRFSDAIHEAEPVAGAQVHRSHWVAWAGVGSVCREGGKMILHLQNGHQIPVSKNHRDKVDAWFPLDAAIKTAAA